MAVAPGDREPQEETTRVVVVDGSAVCQCNRIDADGTRKIDSVRRQSINEGRIGWRPMELRKIATWVVDRFGEREKLTNEEAIGSVPKGLKKGSAACRWKRYDGDEVNVGSFRWKWNRIKEEERRECVPATEKMKKIRESAPDRREKKNTVRVYRCMKKKIDKKKKKMP